jgi:hypothetical protein
VNVGTDQLWRILQDNVAEIKFARRTPKPGKEGTRRMICTNSQHLLNSIDGRMTLNFSPPRRYPRYDPRKKNLIITWDILMQNFRTINMNACNLMQVIPANEMFWKYFKERLAPMTQNDKTNYMDI